MCHTSQAASQGRNAASRLKSVLSRQNFEIVLQAKIGAKILARERIAPYRKDVLTKGAKTVGGGDVTRKKKLLEKVIGYLKTDSKGVATVLGKHAFTLDAGVISAPNFPDSVIG